MKTEFFQLTTSRGDRLVPKAEEKPQNFSTHDLSWRSTTVGAAKWKVIFFQLTTSRGDRRAELAKYAIPVTFSTHDLSWRSTRSSIKHK